jgi:sporulation protein YlmC with PRC-barrel domain
MLEEMTDLKGLDIFSPDGIYVGKVDDYVLDIPNKCISGIFVKNASPVLVDDNVVLKIPFRWVQAIGDIVILKAFPKHVNSDGSVE